MFNFLKPTLVLVISFWFLMALKQSKLKLVSLFTDNIMDTKARFSSIPLNNNFHYFWKMPDNQLNNMTMKD